MGDLHDLDRHPLLAHLEAIRGDRVGHHEGDDGDGASQDEQRENSFSDAHVDTSALGVMVFQISSGMPACNHPQG